MADAIKERIIGVLQPFFDDDPVSRTLETFLRRYLKTAPYHSLVQVIDKVTEFAHEFADVSTPTDIATPTEAVSSADTGGPDTEAGRSSAPSGDVTPGEVDTGETVPGDVAEVAVDTTDGTVGAGEVEQAPTNGSDGHETTVASHTGADGEVFEEAVQGDGTRGQN